MREMLAPTSALIGKGFGESVALITDGRFPEALGVWWSDTSYSEAFSGGNIALIHQGDSITIDATKHLDSDERRRRRTGAPPRRGGRSRCPATPPGVLAKYSRLVSSASTGAVTDG